jgi:alkylation response protein AidB-like acyl-CoA dehydrogenase
MSNRRQFIQTALTPVAMAAIAPFGAFAQSGALPLEQIKIINGFPAGGTADVTSRRIGDKLGNGTYSKNAGVVENKTGAAGRIAVEANMGAIGAIMAYGTDAQKRIAADLVLAGDKPAILITEPEAGSAATEMTTRAVRHGDTWVINGRKTWITGGGVSRLHLIFARVIEDGRDQGIGGFLVARQGDGPPPGISFKRIPSLGLCGMPEAETEIAGLEVPDAGQVFLDGKDISALPPHRRQCGLLFQDFALFPHLSVQDNVAFGLVEQ